MKRLISLLIVGSLLLGACASAGSAMPPSSPPSGGEGSVGIAPDQLKSTANERAFADRATSGAPAAAPAADSATVQPNTTDRMIVYNANMSMGVQNVAETLNAIRGLTQGVGGLVAGVSTGFQKDKESASITIRVPAAAYNQVMTDLRKLATKVNNENDSARDVTDQFTDLDAQLRNFKATEAQLLEFMKKANTIDEILKVQAQLTQTRGQIERLQGQLNVLQRTSDMATIVINVSPADTVAPQTPWNPGQSIEEAWVQSLVVVRNVVDFSLRAAVFAFWLTPLVLMALAVGWVIRRLTPPVLPRQTAVAAQSDGPAAQ